MKAKEIEEIINDHSTILDQFHGVVHSNDFGRLAEAIEEEQNKSIRTAFYIGSGWMVLSWVIAEILWNLIQ